MKAISVEHHKDNIGVDWHAQLIITSAKDAILTKAVSQI